MRVGLGTGSTVAYLLPAIARARPAAACACVATSPATARAARELGLAVHELDELGELDIAIDGADQIDPARLAGQGRRRRAHAREDRRGGGAALRRDRLGREGGHASRPPVPLELLRFGVQQHAAGAGATRSCGARDGLSSPDGGADRRLRRPGRRPARARGAPRARRRAWSAHGLFAPEMVSLVLIGGERRRRAARRRASPRRLPSERLGRRCAAVAAPRRMTSGWRARTPSSPIDVGAHAQQRRRVDVERYRRVGAGVADAVDVRGREVEALAGGEDALARARRRSRGAPRGRAPLTTATAPARRSWS